MLRAKPRLLLFSAFLSPFRSGAESCTEEVARQLAGRYDITIITARLRRDVAKTERWPEEISIQRVGIGFPIDKWLYPFLAPLAARQKQPDLLHGILETFAGLALAFCRFVLPRTPRLLTLQTTNRSFLKNTIIRSAHAVTAISQHLTRIARVAGAPHITHIPNGIPAVTIARARKSHPKKPGRILFVGRLEPQKGVDTLLAAFARVTAHHPEARLRVVGGGSQFSVLRSASSRRRVLDAEASSRPRGSSQYSVLVEQGKVTFTGQLPPKDVYREMAEAEIFCGLSRSEALGNVFLEAQAAGCAVIGTTVHGIPDIITHEENGLLVPPDNAGAAAQQLEQLLSDQSLREGLRQNALRNAAQYDWRHVAWQYGHLYDELLGLPERSRTSEAARNKDSNVPASTHSSESVEAVSSP